MRRKKYDAPLTRPEGTNQICVEIGYTDTVSTFSLTRRGTRAEIRRQEKECDMVTGDST